MIPNNVGDFNTEMITLLKWSTNNPGVLGGQIGNIIIRSHIEHAFCIEILHHI